MCKLLFGYDTYKKQKMKLTPAVIKSFKKDLERQIKRLAFVEEAKEKHPNLSATYYDGWKAVMKNSKVYDTVDLVVTYAQYFEREIERLRENISLLKSGIQLGDKYNKRVAA